MFRVLFCNGRLHDRDDCVTGTLDSRAVTVAERPLLNNTLRIHRTRHNYLCSTLFLISCGQCGQWTVPYLSNCHLIRKSFEKMWTSAPGSFILTLGQWWPWPPLPQMTPQSWGCNESQFTIGRVGDVACMLDEIFLLVQWILVVQLGPCWDLAKVLQ